jgi:hypothetical protein
VALSKKSLKTSIQYSCLYQKLFLLIRNFILGQIGIGQSTFSVELPKQNSPPYNGWLQLRDLVDVTFPQPVGHSDQRLQVNQVPFTEMKRKI